MKLRKREKKGGKMESTTGALVHRHNADWVNFRIQSLII